MLLAYGDWVIDIKCWEKNSIITSLSCVAEGISWTKQTTFLRIFHDWYEKENGEVSKYVCKVCFCYQWKIVLKYISMQSGAHIRLY